MINNTKLEAQIISTLLTDDSLVIKHANELQERFFYKRENKEIIKIIKALKDKSLTPDHEAVSYEIEKRAENIDVYDYLTPLNLNNFEASIISLRELASKRHLNILGNTLVSESSKSSADVFKMSNKLSLATNELMGILTTEQIEDNLSLMRNVLTELEEARKSKGRNGLLTGINGIDEVTGGFKKGALIILAARPAMGKTALAIGQAMHASIHEKKNVLFFSLEMSGTELMKRQFSLISGINLSDLTNGKEVDFSQLNQSIKPLENSFKMFDKCFSLYDIKAQSRREDNLKKVDAIYIDYLQLIQHRVDKGRSKENEVSEISRELKLLAKELECPIICLSQLSRAVESRGGEKIPQLSDLRDSGSIEQDADIVNFIYRPEYYGILQDEDGNSTEGVAMLIFAKHRAGRTCSVKMKFEGNLTMFSDWNEAPKPLNNSIIEPDKMDWLE